MPAILELINPDGISYIAIAQHWADGRFADAINAYWSPLFSLLMVPWLLAGVPALLAAKLTLLLAGAALVLGGWALVGIVSTHLLVRVGATLLMALLAFEWSLAVVTPDLITVAIFLWYLVALDRLRRSGSARDAIACGLRGSSMATNPYSLETGGAPWTSWNDGLYVSWHAGLRFHGVVPPRADVPTVERALEAENIETFVLVGPGPVPDYLHRFRDVARLPTLSARVFHRAAR